MKNSTKKTFGIASLVLGASLATGCGGMTEEQKDPWATYLVQGTPSVLTVDVGSDCGDVAEIRFYDNDGDKKTVEEYVALTDTRAAFPAPRNVRAHLIRKGLKQTFDSARPAAVMTPEQEREFDARYQSLVAMYK